MCDNIDNDCDGDTDDADDDTVGQTVYYYDGDGDGYGRSDYPIARCTDPGYPTIGGDCDDGDAGVHPDAADPVGDGIDQNCDGVDGHS